jgi:transposase
MRKILDVLRLRFESNLSHERIAAATRMSKGAVTNYLSRAKAAGIGWPLPASVDDAELEARLFPRAAPLVERRAAPDLAHLHQELKRKGVTLMLLWEEYAAAHAGHAYGYSQFCLLYHRFAAGLKRSMRQLHRAGDKLFIDYAGQSVPIIDAATGEIHRAQIFVAVLGASSYTYAEASLTQQLPDWIASHVRCFEHMGVVAALLVPDNLKSAIKHACRYEPRVHLHLRGSRPSLRHGNLARATVQAPGQGRRRAERALGGALDSRAASQSAVLLARGAQCGHSGAAHRSE